MLIIYLHVIQFPDNLMKCEQSLGQTANLNLRLEGKYREEMFNTCVCKLKGVRAKTITVETFTHKIWLVCTFGIYIWYGLLPLDVHRSCRLSNDANNVSDL